VVAVSTLQAPFPWFGGKSRVADVIWDRFGAVDNYVEPFFGSGAVLLSRPTPGGIETVNDKDRFVANFWRAVSSDPEAVVHWLDWPVNEVDLTARHLWLIGEGAARIERCDVDPDFCDAQVAGWWCWGACSWIGSGWCSGNGPWTRDGDGWGKGNRGVNRQLPSLSGNQGVNRKRPCLSVNQGVNRKLPLLEWVTRLSERLRAVRVCSGDWSRVCGDSVTWRHGVTAIFLDPPYADTAGRTVGLYAQDSLTVAHDAREWAIEAARNPLMRIAFAGYQGEHTFPADWSAFRWKAQGGFGNQGSGAGRSNAMRETIWLSPHCVPARQPGLFDLEDPAEARLRAAFSEPEFGQ
jgi:DNA adenine methylase